MAYSLTSDLLVGNVPLPSYVDKQKFVDDAANEIDSKIGYIYTTPVDVSDSGPVSRPARILIKRISNYLASGRLLMTVDVTEEKNSVHAYAARLIREATDALTLIARDSITLDGAPRVNTSVRPTVPLIANLDSESNVEAFYNRIILADPLVDTTASYADWEDGKLLRGGS